ncbi:pyridoxal-dependent decarboxylase [Aeromicrobium sp. UC242_57]|uniref:pyridoxal-dependent decarboxylase n=1 Tax=Aeromicrobium sp. UC242_57 TaxID=3374624 RepID=UPI0037BAC686
MPTFALNFSRPGSEVVAQYYTFFRLGRSGLRDVQQACRDVATYLSSRIEAMPEFTLLSRGDELPVFAFTTSEHAGTWDVFAVSRALRERGWQVPAYTFPEDRQDLSVLRIVCRNGFGHDLADLLIADLTSAVATLNAHPTTETRSGPAGFRH